MLRKLQLFLVTVFVVSIQSGQCFPVEVSVIGSDNGRLLNKSTFPPESDRGEVVSNIRGTIKDERGNPVPDVPVAVFHCSTTTDSAGRYSLEARRVGYVTLRVGGNGYAEKNNQPELPVLCAFGKDREVDFVVTKAGILKVKLEPADTRQPLPERAAIALTLISADNSGPDLNTDLSLDSRFVAVKDGEAVFKDIAPGDYQVDLISGEQLMGHSAVIPLILGTTNVTIVRDRETVQCFKLSKLVAVSGRITDEQGQPVNDVAVNTLRNPQAYSRRTKGVLDPFKEPMQDVLHSDEAGKFCLGLMPEGSRIALSIYRKGYCPTNCLVDTAKGEAVTVDIVLKRELEITGRLMDCDGKPAKHTHIHITAGASTLMRVAGVIQFRHVDSDVNDEGEFRIGGLWPGKYKINFSTFVVKGLPEASLSGIEAGTNGLIVQLEKTKTITITGVVKNREGLPLDAVIVDVTSHASGKTIGTWAGPAGIQTGADGRFSGFLRTGEKHTLGFNLTPYLRKTVNIDLREGSKPVVSDLNIVLDRGVQVSGSVLDAKGIPSAGVAVVVTPEEVRWGGFKIGAASSYSPNQIDYDLAAPAHCVTDSNGRFYLEDVASGVMNFCVYSITNDTENHIERRLFAKEALLTSDRTNNVVIVQPAMGSLKGHFTTTLRRKGMWIDLVPLYSVKGSMPRRLMQSLEMGNGERFEVNPLPAGCYRINCFDKKLTANPVMPRVVEVKAGEITNVEIGPDLQAPNTITVCGTVKKDGKPLQNGTIRYVSLPKNPSGEDLVAEDGSGEFRNIVLAPISEGAFILSNVTVGAYTYNLYAERVHPSGKRGKLNKAPMFDGEGTLLAGQTNLEINIAGEIVAGLVRMSDGEAAAGCLVTLIPAVVETSPITRDRRTVHADEQGRFRFVDIIPGNYGISVSVHKRSENEEGWHGEVLVSKGMKPCDIKLGPLFTISGKVNLTDAIFAGTSVTAVSDDKLESETRNVPNVGGYSFKAKFSRGTFNLFCTRPGFAVDTAVLQVTNNTTHDFSLVPGGSLKVRVTRDNMPVQGLVVCAKTSTGEVVLRLRGTGGDFHAWHVNPTDKNGETVIYGLKAGKYLVYIDGDKATASVEVKAMETTEAELKI